MGWLKEMDELDDCAKNPTNPLSQKAKNDPHYQHDVLDQMDDAKGDVQSTFVPMLGSDVAGYLGHFLPFGGGAVAALVFSTQDEAVSEFAETRINDARKYLVPCEDKRKGLRGSVEFTYKRSSSVPGNQQEFSGTADGKFELKQDPHGFTVFAGEGDGKLDMAGTVEGYNFKQYYHTSGPLTISVSGRGDPQDATLELTIHGEHLTWTYACAGAACDKGSSEQQEHGFVRGCEFNGVNLVAGGTYSVPADSDGTGAQSTCKLKLAGRDLPEYRAPASQP